MICTGQLQVLVSVVFYPDFCSNINKSYPDKTHIKIKLKSSKQPRLVKNLSLRTALT